MEIEMDDNEDISCDTCCFWFKKRFCTKEKMLAKLPCLEWIPNYSMKDLRCDLIAGLSVGFTVIPQALAYSVLAGLPPHYGLYTSFIGCFVYAIFGSCRYAAVGPTSILAIMVAPYVAIGGVTYAILLSFYSGLIMLFFGLLNMGFVAEFVSFPVISGFSTAAALTIAASQLKGLFGIHYRASRIVPILIGLFQHIQYLSIRDTLMGCTCLAFLLPVQFFKDIAFCAKDDEQKVTNSRRYANVAWKLIVTSRNAIVVLTCGVIAYFFDGFTITPNIRTGLPPISPPFGSLNNETSGLQALQEILPGAAVVSLVGLLEMIAVAKAFGSSGIVRQFDPTQEMVALGFCNIAGSFVSAFPLTGSFSRSAVNSASGVKTPFAGIITGTIVIGALVFLAPYFEYIPQTALSSMIIAAVLPIMKITVIGEIWTSHKVDIVPYLVTLGCCLGIGLEYGIIAGVLVSVAILMYLSARPKIRIVCRKNADGESILHVKPDRSVLFPSVEYMRMKIIRAMKTEATCVAIVFNGEHMFRTDSTFVTSFKSMIGQFEKMGVTVVLYNLRAILATSLHRSLPETSHCLICSTEQEMLKAIRTTHYGSCQERMSTSSNITAPVTVY